MDKLRVPEKVRHANEWNGGNGNESSSADELSKGKKRWHAVLGRIAPGYSGPRTAAHDDPQANENLIEEIKRMKKKKKQAHAFTKQGGVLNILHSTHTSADRVLEKHKYSAKERIMPRRISNKTLMSESSTQDDTLLSYDNDARLRYPISSDIRIKLERIKKEAEKEDENQTKKEGKVSKHWYDRIVTWFLSTNMGETIRANHRFYKMSPHEHLPELCRRCRRPLAATLEARYTAVGILFCILLPVIGILLLYANREFNCVVCDELYVYGDLTARPVEGKDSEAEDEIETEHLA